MRNYTPKKKKDLRQRNYATVVYPESAPEGWLEILNDAHVPAFVSPLHDSDINPDGTPKKAHYHVMVMFDNVKTREQAKALFDTIGGVGCETMQSVRGYARYLCHLDNPEKHQYSIDNVKCFSGSDYRDVIGLPVDRAKAIYEMTQYCRQNKPRLFADFLVYCYEEHPDWYRVLIENGTYIMIQVIRSIRWDGREQ